MRELLRIYFFEEKGTGRSLFDNLFGFSFCAVPSSFFGSSTGHFHWFFYGCFFLLFLLPAWGRGNVSAGAFLFIGSWVVTFAGVFSGVAEVDF